MFMHSRFPGVSNKGYGKENRADTFKFPGDN